MQKIKPVPALSEKNSRFVLQIIQKNKFDYIIEFGSGNSTLFFYKKLKELNRHTCFISHENSEKYYQKIKKEINKNLGPSSEEIKKWTIENYNKFYNSRRRPWVTIVEGKSRLQKWKNAIRLGPFWKILPESKSLLSLHPRIVWLFAPFLEAIVKTMRTFGYLCHADRYFHKKSNYIDFHYYNISPGIKDQFGESPTRQSYTCKWIKHIQPKSKKSLLFLIDGGPRHFIIDKIAQFKKKYKSMSLFICLFDAYRPEYAKTLSKIKNGKFFPSSCFDLNGRKIYDKCRTNELWFGKM